MTDRKYAAWILSFLVLLLTCGCTEKEGNRAPEEMEEFYNQFIEAFSEGDFEDVEPFLHFEIEEYRKLSEEFFVNIQNPRNEGWEKIQDDLWVAHTYVESKIEPEGRVAQYFVGYIDGELRIMTGPFQVPEELAKDADLSRFISPDVLIPEEFENTWQKIS